MTVFDVQTVSRSLVGNMTIEAFNARIREREAARFEAAIPVDRFDGLFSLATLETLLESEAIPLAYVDVFDDGHLKKLVDLQKKSGKSGLLAAAENLRRGATIRVRDIDTFDARLNRLAGQVQRDFTARAQINLYLTPPGQAGFPPHFDITDVFVLQCRGTKEWDVFHDYSNRVDLPPMATDWDPDRYRPAGSPDRMTLHPGDVLYLPRGAMHQASCTARESMHLTISLVPLTFADVIVRAVARATAADVDLRRRVPWSVDGGAEEHAAVACEVRDRIVRMAAQLDVPAVLDAEAHALGGDRPERQSGLLDAAVARLIGRAR